jgi:cytidine deaminase
MPTLHSADDVLVMAARQAALSAYSPYSKFRVGAAAVFAETDTLFTGCNVENSSYGLTICAERVAICSAVAQNHRGLLRIAIAVVDPTGLPLKSFMPCGACLQVIKEFGTISTQIIIDGLGKRILQDLLPLPF